MNLSRRWSLALTLLVSGLQFFAVGDLITSPHAIRWMIAIAGFIRLAQVTIAQNSNPDGSPAPTATAFTTIDLKDK